MFWSTLCSLWVCSLVLPQSVLRAQISPPADTSAQHPDSLRAVDSSAVTSQKDGILTRAADTFLEDHPARVFGQPAKVNVLPIVYHDFRTGWNFGFRAVFKSGFSRPHSYWIKLQVIGSNKGSHKHKLLFDYPNIRNSPWGFRVLAEWRRDLVARYYGLGNASVRDKNAIDPGAERFVDKDFYVFNLKRPRLAVYGTHRITRDMTLWLGLGLDSAEPQLKSDPERSFLGEERPFGYHGGDGQYLSLRLTWDTRSHRVFPRRGFLAQASIEPNWASVEDEIDATAGSQKISRSVRFQRFTVSDAHFFPIKSDRLILANRVAFEAVTGTPPFYVLGEFSGLRRARALGGSQSLRGFKSRRYQDNIKFITLTELRYNLRRFEVFSQALELIAMAFLDSGRVWRRWSDLSLHDLHLTQGLGVWLNWNNSMILRLDLGRSSEGWSPYLRLSTAF